MSNSKYSNCVRQVGNWSHIKRYHIYDSQNFDLEKLKSDIPTMSSKLELLLKNIEELDAKDMQLYGHKFKHVVFSSLMRGYGAKLLIGALMTKNIGFAHDDRFNLHSDSKLLSTKGDNMMALLSTNSFGKPLQQNQKRLLLKKFNERPTNSNGDLIRFAVLDKGFKEGIDMFDVKYLHMYEPQTSLADERQVIGRATRLCGQAGLTFDDEKGWPIDIFIYEISLNDTTSLTSHTQGADGIKTRNLIERIEHITKLSAVDRVLNVNVNENIYTSMNTVLNESSNLNKVKKIKLVDSREIFCDKCTPRKATKYMPISVPLFVMMHLNQRRQFPKKMRRVDVRPYFCSMLSSDESFCLEGKRLWADPQSYIRDAINSIDDNEYLLVELSKLPSPIRRLFRNMLEDLDSLNVMPAKQRINPIIDKKLSYDDMQDFISANYIRYSWPKLQNENLCVLRGGAEIINLSPTQNFLRKYFTPQCPYKGMLMWHSVGTGKTCAAISIASSSFEKDDYTILWVTRTTLKSTVFKNMYDQVCNVNIVPQIENKSNLLRMGKKEIMPLVSSSWKRIQPISYKQFTNLISGKNRLYDDLVKINGKDDPLKKTLIIIDEAHKLYGGDDLTKMETPDMNKMSKVIEHSYKTSKENSVRLLLMTATPIVNDCMEMIKLLNLLRPREESLKEDMSSFISHYGIDTEGNFSSSGEQLYKDDVSGYISYLNRERDMRQFAQPIIHIMNSKLSGLKNISFEIEFESLQSTSILMNDRIQVKIGLLAEYVVMKKGYSRSDSNYIELKEKIELLKQEIYDAKVEYKELLSRMKKIKVELDSHEDQETAFATCEKKFKN